MLQIEIEKGNEMEKDLIKKYEAILPDELLEIWENYGFANLLDGYLRVINPEDYKALLDETYFRSKVSVSIITTAFGDVITIEEGEYIGIVKYKDGTFSMLAKSFKRFMQFITDDYFVGKYLQIPQYEEAVKRLGKLKQDECFGYVPVLGLGGSEQVENLNKVSTRVHIEIITQLVGRIGM